MIVVNAVVRPLARGLASRGMPGARSIHLPPLSRAAGRRLFLGQVQTLIRKALTGITTNAYGRALFAGKSYSRMVPHKSIASTLSSTARFTLARPMGRTPFMPQPIHVARNMTQVGLGTARTFATSRPIFANLVEHVPVAARSLIEADFNLKSAPAQRLRSLKSDKSAKKAHKSKAKARVAPIAAVASTELDLETLSQYFKATPEAAVISYLDIPLAPTPTGRVPLAERPLPGPVVAPLLAVAETHATHNKHAIRVASLFRRLDAARVWDNGAAMEAFGDRTGLCTVLRIKFSGWTKDMVLRVIGEGGKAWCTLIETESESRFRSTTVEEETSSGALSSGSLSPLPWASERSNMSEIDYSAANDSFIMPTMDFSASFSARTSSVTPSVVTSEVATPLTVYSDIDEQFSSSSDGDDVQSLSDNSESFASVWGSDSVQSVRSGLSFSSEHWRRVSTVIGDF